jgi:hypothetical protein
MAVLSLFVCTMSRDGKRFSGVRWVVVITCVPSCLVCCRSTNHTFQLCGRHLIHDRYACVLSNGASGNIRRRNPHATTAPCFGCTCLLQVRTFASVLKSPSHHCSMSPCICVSTIQLPSLAAESPIYSAPCLMVFLLGDAT